MGEGPEIASNDRPARAAPSGRPDFALLDVRKSLAAPVVRTDTLLPVLSKALQTIFGDRAQERSLQQERSTDGSGVSTCSDPQVSGSPRSQGVAEVGALHGHQWLYSWGTREFALDSVSLRGTLGDVGLTGLVGWLLEYPVVYCCPPGPHGGGATNDSASFDPGNCLAMIPLTVYSLNVSFGGGSLTPPTTPLLETWSFSVPQVVRFDDSGVKGMLYDEKDTARAARQHLSGLVDAFLSSLRRRAATFVVSASQQGLDPELLVNQRTEILDRVAL